MIQFDIELINKGGDADEHRLRLAESAQMYAGLNRAVSYCLLSLESATLAERATRNSNVKIYQRRTGDQCIIHQIAVEITQHPGSFYAGMASSVAASYLCKFIDFCFKSAAGMLKADGGEDELNQYSRVEPFFDQLTEKIEPHLLDIHGPIHRRETVTLNMEGAQVYFDNESKEYLSESNLLPGTFELMGAVTRLNILTGNGRFRSRDVGRIVPFSQTPGLKDSPASKTLSWSLRENDQGRPGIVKVQAKKIVSNTGRVKRLIIENIEAIG